MKGRQPGRPIKWVDASIGQWLGLNKTGITFVIYNKWKRNRKRLGALTVSVGGLRWRPAKGKEERVRTWNQVAEWLS